MTTVLIGLDDTDNADSRGTGYLARRLSAECVRRGMRPLGVTRHQFLMDPRIPYTSHNSGACVAVACERDETEAAFAFEFVAGAAAQGSDPGVCLARLDAVTTASVAFGREATRRIVGMAEAFDAARGGAIALRALGGSGLGIIGALGSVALRAEGREGRFIDLVGLRDLSDRVKVDAFERLGIGLAHESGRTPGPDDVYETLGWVRPRLVDGRPVLPVGWDEERHAWLPVDRKRTRPLE